MRTGTRTILFSLTIALLGYLFGLVTAWFIVISRPVGLDAVVTCLKPAAQQMVLFWDVWDIVQLEFIGQVPDSQTVTYGAIRGALTTLNDPYTAFIEPRSHEREKEDLQGKFGGIGVTMARDEAGQVVINPMPDAPAIQAGVQKDDILAMVATTPITPGVSFDDITALVRGPVGTPITIQIRRGKPPVTHTFTIVRQEIVLPSVSWQMVEGEPEIGYIALTRFSEKSKEELVQAISELRASGATRLILDLRDNGGGLRQAGIEVASQFLADGVVMYQRYRDDSEEPFNVMSGGVALDVPLVILVNQSTASASEIVAGALQDRGRAKLVGEQTYGKGSVQHLYDLRDGSSLHVTVAEWLTPNRHQLRGQGLVPDVLVVRSPDDANAGRDPQLDAAVEQLKSEK